MKNRELAKDKEFMAECKASAGCGLVFTYYQSFDCFNDIRKKFPTAGASVPGGLFACFRSEGSCR